MSSDKTKTPHPGKKGFSRRDFLRSAGVAVSLAVPLNPWHPESSPSPPKRVAPSGSAVV